MMLYRLADKKYVEDQAGIGAKLFGGRWNTVETPCLYTSEHLSLAFLEKFVHARAKENMHNIGLLTIKVPEIDGAILNVDDEKLNKNWMDDIGYSQWIGDQILEDAAILAFSVPSVLIPNERNYIINPKSIYFSKLIFEPIVDFKTDYRFLSHLL